MPKVENTGMKGEMYQGQMKKITPKQVVDELAAIGFARATNFLRVSDGERHHQLR